MLIQTNQLIKIYGSGENALRALDGVSLSEIGRASCRERVLRLV